MRAAEIVKSAELCEWVVFLKDMSFVLHKPLSLVTPSLLCNNPSPPPPTIHWREFATEILRVPFHTPQPPTRERARSFTRKLAAAKSAYTWSEKGNAADPCPSLSVIDSRKIWHSPLNSTWPQTKVFALCLLRRWAELVAAQVADNWFRLVCVWF